MSSIALVTFLSFSLNKPCRCLSLNSNLLSLSATAVALGFSISVFWTILPPFMWDLKFDFLEMAMVYVSQSLVVLIFSRAMGIYADATGRKNFITMELTVLLVAYVIFYLFVEENLVCVASIILFSVLIGLATAVGGGALAAAITTVLGRERASVASGIFMASDALGWTLGSFASGILVDMLGVKSTLLVSIFSTLLGLLAVSFYREKFVKIHTSFKKAFKAAWKLSLPSRDNLLLRLFAIVSVFSFGSSMYFLVFIIKFYIIVGSKTLYGILSGVSGIVSTVTPYFFGVLGERVRQEKILVCALFVRTLLMIVLVFSWDLTLSIVFWLMPLWTIISLGFVSLTTSYSLEARESEAHAMRNVVGTIFMALGDIVGGVVSEMIGAAENVASMSIVLGLGAAVHSIGIPLAIMLIKKSGIGSQEQNLVVVSTQGSFPSRN